MACPPLPQPPSVFMSLFPSTPAQWVILLVSCCLVLLMIFIQLFRLARFLRPLPAGPQQWILLTLAGVGLLGFAGFVFCFLWTMRWQQATSSWLTQVGAWLRQNCFPHASIPYEQGLFSGDWVFYLEWVFLISGTLLYLLVRWRAEYLIRRREQRAIEHAQGGGKKIP